MDKKLFGKWFNGKYGKLPPERQLEEIEKLRAVLDDFEESRHRKFDRYHEKCPECGKYSLRSAYDKRYEVEKRRCLVPGYEGERTSVVSVEYYTCPQCGIEYENDEKFIKYEE